MFQLKGIQGQETTAIFPPSFITLNPTASRCGGFQCIPTIFSRIKRVCWVDEKCRYRTKLRYMITRPQIGMMLPFILLKIQNHFNWASRFQLKYIQGRVVYSEYAGVVLFNAFPTNKNFKNKKKTLPSKGYVGLMKNVVTEQIIVKRPHPQIWCFWD